MLFRSEGFDSEQPDCGASRFTEIDGLQRGTGEAVCGVGRRRRVVGALCCHRKRHYQDRQGSTPDAGQPAGIVHLHKRRTLQDKPASKVPDAGGTVNPGLQRLRNREIPG